jgi:hypothetical protein
MYSVFAQTATLSLAIVAVDVNSTNHQNSWQTCKTATLKKQEGNKVHWIIAISLVVSFLLGRFYQHLVSQSVDKDKR